MRGACSDDEEQERRRGRGTFCVRTKLGASREISLERTRTRNACVLADGRVAVLRPPWGKYPRSPAHFRGRRAYARSLSRFRGVPKSRRGGVVNALEEVLTNVLGTWVEVRHAHGRARLARRRRGYRTGARGHRKRRPSRTVRARLGKSRHAAESVGRRHDVGSPFEMPAFELPPARIAMKKVACVSRCAERGMGCA